MRCRPSVPPALLLCCSPAPNRNPRVFLLGPRLSLRALGAVFDRPRPRTGASASIARTGGREALGAFTHLQPPRASFGAGAAPRAARASYWPGPRSSRGARPRSPGSGGAAGEASGPDLCPASDAGPGTRRGASRGCGVSVSPALYLLRERSGDRDLGKAPTEGSGVAQGFRPARAGGRVLPEALAPSGPGGGGEAEWTGSCADLGPFPKTGPVLGLKPESCRRGAAARSPRCFTINPEIGLRPTTPGSVNMPERKTSNPSRFLFTFEHPELL